MPNFVPIECYLGAVWILMFPSLIIQFSSLITEKWWDHGDATCLDLFSNFVFMAQFLHF